MPAIQLDRSLVLHNKEKGEEIMGKLQNIIWCMSLGLSGTAMATNPDISAYFLSGPQAPFGTPGYYASIDQLEMLSRSIASNKSSFNKLMLSFVQPSYRIYQPGSLECTGLFGYTCDNVLLSEAIDRKGKKPRNATDDFVRLRNVISELKSNGVDTYLAVGGWNFSCIPEYYDATVGAPNSCGPEGEVYDSFPNPLTGDRFDSQISGVDADTVYNNIVQLTYSLGAAGIDLDYEEFWHADLNAFSWNLTPDSIQPPTTNINYINNDELMSLGKGDQVYNNDMTLRPGADTVPRIMPATVDKFAAIMRSIYTAIDEVAPELKLTVAAPATGGIPNMSANWGTVATQSSIYGGAWWGGNLYGLLYNTAVKYPDLINRLSHIGLMSYDLSETDCGADSEIPCDLAGQVDFYYGQYMTWMKSDNSLRQGNAIIKGAPNYATSSLQPLKVLVTPPITVGYEVGKPATGNLPLTTSELTKIVTQSAKYGHFGMIMWDLYKDKRYDEPNHGWNDEWARPIDVLQTVCSANGLTGDMYDCNSNIPESRRRR
ncbi:hypothetical protein D3C77_351970 [compost metagenome]